MAVTNGRPYRIQLDRLGSDPEFVLKDGLHVYPAVNLVGNDRDLRLAAWVGTDGHAATAEIRPGPAHNVLFHLYKIGDALTKTKRFLLASPRTKHLEAVAQPIWNDETMGGHIHLSFWCDGILTSELYNKYYVAGAGGVLIPMGRAPKKIDSPVLERLYWEGVHQGVELDLETVVEKLHYGLAPLEHALFGKNRERRWNNTQVRDLYRIPDYRTFREDPRAYFRLEYRYPSTWLSSPEMAYTFLALAKLIMLNLENVPTAGQLPRRRRRGNPFGEVTITAPPPEVHETTQKEWRALAAARYAELKQLPGLRVTPDLQWLDESIASLLKSRYTSPLLIKFEEWDKLLRNTEGERAF